MWSLLVMIVHSCFTVSSTDRALNCRERSGHLRLDGGQCFEIPDWHYEPVKLDEHIERLKERWGAENLRRKITREGGAPPITLSYSEVSRYMDTVLAPFLDTYHKNIQNSYLLMTEKISKKIKAEISQALIKKRKINETLVELADKLMVPAMCDEERRDIKTLASKHVAVVYACAESGRATIGKMGKYAEDMITLTRNHMQTTLDDATEALRAGESRKDTNKSDVANCLADLSRAAITLGYELDLSLTNARRHNEQSCEKLSNCSNRARRLTDEHVSILKDRLYQCVYA